ncbi:glycosyltransferase family 4 protein [Oscillochloris sp. ZM17-4]|uniref:glycosyltransferase family 4 protein n=1 Tax=Oscillochloris sp. ZM17-4 TaxID=2866714 RepID=UPI001C73C3BD|nr:glycosyltransferase family 4 protein [Oscillochloris sp. ZM17-4]MBX0326317.1 glycosyltransferase family 4 protein [Oscillochloris sp. ZM17-4]
MKILQITPHYYPQRGGVERHVQSISEGLAAHGHEVAVLTMAAPGSGGAVEEIGGVLVFRLLATGPAPAYHVPMGLLSCLGSSGGYDIIHVHNYHAALLPIVAALAPQRMVVTPHLNDRPHSRLAELLHVPYRLIGGWSLRRARAIICVSEAERERLIGRFGLRASVATVIPNGVDIARAMRGETEARDPRQLLAVGRLQAYKGASRAVAAMADLPSGYRLTIIGTGPCHNDLQRQAQALGVADRVELIGEVGDTALSSWYRRSGVVLNMSSAEAFGITVIEALAHGCRVVCNDIPAFRDLASRFPANIALVDAARAPSVAAAARQAADTPAPCADVSVFSWEHIVGQLLSTYAIVRAAEGADAPSRYTSTLV